MLNWLYITSASQFTPTGLSRPQAHLCCTQIMNSIDQQVLVTWTKTNKENKCKCVILWQQLGQIKPYFVWLIDAKVTHWFLPSPCGCGGTEEVCPHWNPEEAHSACPLGEHTPVLLSCGWTTWIINHCDSCGMIFVDAGYKCSTETNKAACHKDHVVMMNYFVYFSTTNTVRSTLYVICVIRVSLFIL